jgi:hypothetical protein
MQDTLPVGKMVGLRVHMAFRHEVLHIRRQKQPLIDIPGLKILAHSPTLNQSPSELNSDYSDMLLPACRTEGMRRRFWGF